MNKSSTPTAYNDMNEPIPSDFHEQVRTNLGDAYEQLHTSHLQSTAAAGRNKMQMKSFAGKDQHMRKKPSSYSTMSASSLTSTMFLISVGDGLEAHNNLQPVTTNTREAQLTASLAQTNSNRFGRIVLKNLIIVFIIFFQIWMVKN